MSSGKRSIRGYSAKFDELRRRSVVLGIPFSVVHPNRFESIESFDGLTALIDGDLRQAAVRVVFLLSSGADPAFIRIDANFFTGLLEFGDFDSRRRLMVNQRFNIKFHADYLARGNEEYTLISGARLIQLSVAAWYLERDGHQPSAQAIWRLLEARHGEMPPELGRAPSFAPSKLFTL